jgi:hypothetical protein
MIKFFELRLPYAFPGIPLQLQFRSHLAVFFAGGTSFRRRERILRAALTSQRLDLVKPADQPLAETL